MQLPSMLVVLRKLLGAKTRRIVEKVSAMEAQGDSCHFALLYGQVRCLEGLSQLRSIRNGTLFQKCQFSNSLNAY